MVLPEDAEAATSVIVAPGALPPTLLQQAVLAGNTELARDLIALEREWRKDRAREAFDEAISAAKAEIPPIIKNRQAHNSKYADFAAIAKAIRSYSCRTRSFISLLGRGRMTASMLHAFFLTERVIQKKTRFQGRLIQTKA